jgi:hypothetical protein
MGMRKGKCKTYDRGIAAHLQFREHSGNIQGTFREHSGNIQGTFRES